MYHYLNIKAIVIVLLHTANFIQLFHCESCKVRTVDKTDGLNISKRIKVGWLYLTSTGGQLF